MRVLIVTPLYPPDLGDLASYVRTFATELHKTDDVAIATYGELPEAISGIPISATSKRLPTLVRLSLFTVRLWKQSKKMDVLYVADGASIGLPAVLVSFFRRIPLIRFVIQDETWERAFHAKLATTDEATFILSRTKGRLALIKYLQRLVLRSAKIVFVPSLFYQSLFKKGYGVASAVLPLPAETALQLPFSPEPVTHQLLSTEYLERTPGFDRLFSAIATLRVTTPDISLVMANTGRAQNYYQQLAQSLGIGAHVVFLGQVSRAEQEDLARNSAAQIIMTMDNAGTRSFHRAAARGIAVITDESSELAATIQKVLSDTSFKQSLIADGKRLVAEQASWESHLSLWRSLVEKSL